uniref:Uncharacterized protein n=1 Tax=Anopheles christyi TaxID=43041 RepID=A0A182KIJ7_9DIPT
MGVRVQVLSLKSTDCWRAIAWNYSFRHGALGTGTFWAQHSFYEASSQFVFRKDKLLVLRASVPVPSSSEG